MHDEDWKDDEKKTPNNFKIKIHRSKSDLSHPTQNSSMTAINQPSAVDIGKQNLN